MDGAAGPGPWQGAGDRPGPDSINIMGAYFDFLSEDLLLPGGRALLDPATLQAAAAAAGPRASTSQPAKRVRRDEGDADAGSNDDLGDCSDDGDEPPKQGRRKTSAAAQNKAHREKARREKINDRFAELARLIEPGQEPKTDKLSILQEAIRCVQQMQVENSQLKQLNKFMEEKVGAAEKERAQMLYQMYQMGGPAMLAPMLGGGMQAGCMMAGPIQQPPPQLPFGRIQQQLPLMSMQAASKQDTAAPFAYASSAVAGDLRQQQQQPEVVALDSNQNMQQQPNAPSAQLPPQRRQLQQQVPDGTQQQQQPPFTPVSAMLAAAEQPTAAVPNAQQDDQQQQQVVILPNDMAPAGSMQVAVMMQSMDAMAGPTAAAAAAAAGGGGQGLLGAPGKLMMPSNVAMPYWASMMPNSMMDPVQDSLLRPPAA